MQSKKKISAYLVGTKHDRVSVEILDQCRAGSRRKKFSALCSKYAVVALPKGKGQTSRAVDRRLHLPRARQGARAFAMRERPERSAIF